MSGLSHFGGRPPEPSTIGAVWLALKVFGAELGPTAIHAGVKAALTTMQKDHKEDFEHALGMAGAAYRGAGGPPIAELRASTGYRMLTAGLTMAGNLKLAMYIEHIVELLEGATKPAPEAGAGSRFRDSRGHRR